MIVYCSVAWSLNFVQLSQFLKTQKKLPKLLVCLASCSELECSYSGRRFLVVECDAINAVISELYCIFGDIPGVEQEEICEL